MESIFIVKYLNEYESIFEPALARESVDPGVLSDEKPAGQCHEIFFLWCHCPFKKRYQ
jgi:hypothetical protein